MKKIKYCLFFILFIAVLSAFSGCGGSSSNSNQDNIPQGNIQLVLSGFPSGDTLGDIVVGIYDSSNALLNNYKFQNTGVEEFKQQIAVSANTALIMVYLLNDSNSYPVYLYGFAFSPTQQNYQTCYWLYYSAYSNNQIEFGISESLAKNVNYDFTETHNFNEAPYYLYKINNAKGQSLSLIATTTRGLIYVKNGAAIQDLGRNSIGPASEINRYVTSESDTMYLLVKPNDYGIPTDFSITLQGRKALPVNNQFTAMTMGDTQDIIYGIANKKNFIYYVHPVTKTTETISLPSEYAIMSCVYSKSSNKLYLAVQKTIDSYTVVSCFMEWDCKQKSIVYETTIPTENTYERIVNLAVDETNNRIYLLYSSSIYIIDKNDHKIISSIKTNYSNGAGSSIYLSGNGKKLLIAYYYSLREYSVENVQNISLMQTKSIGNLIAMSPDGSKLVYWSNFKVNIVNANNFNEILCSYDAYGEPSAAVFSPDGTKLYFYSSDHYIYTVDAVRGSLIKKMLCPTGNYEYNYSTVLSTNSDGQVLVCSRGDYQNGGLLYFCETAGDTNANASKVWKAGFSLQKMLFKELIPWEAKK